MKSRIALVTLGFALAFALSWYPSRTVSASSDPSVDVRRNVTLVCGGFTSNICTDLEQVAADGTLTPYNAPPSGLVLVVTDFVWKAAAVTPGQVAFATLHHPLTSPPHDVAFSTEWPRPTAPQSPNPTSTRVYCSAMYRSCLYPTRRTW